ncbi:glycosyltransferase family 4 protein [Clostridium psychrophilum]|uniref:glycosyltransferase family 4 protein n=1 Tax=Clostridium psychrophilum TaxID=132926 RepID=UPI001C0DE6B4|nr:glycosyltransferase family 4 protein [Clostridium psychrophilum]MBU3180685.1 glycosyltransferase family 4 protein [Clostridium psychrophilum]
MKVLHLLSTGEIGGIEVLCKDISKYSDWDNIFCFVFSGGQITNEIDKTNGKVIVLKKSKNKLSLLKLRKLVSICNNEKVDIVNIHHNNVFLQFYYTKLKQFLPKVKFVMTLHSCFEKEYNYCGNFFIDMCRKYYINKSLQISNLIIAVSKAGKRTYEENFNLLNKMIVVIYNGISPEILDKGKDNYNVCNDCIELMYIGRLVKIKGLENLILAMDKLYIKYNIHLTLVGDGKDRKCFEKLVHKYSLEEYITFVGFQRNLDYYFRKANIFIYPSICKEIFGISIVEAMAYGLPCVANKIGGIPEIIIDGENGFLTKKNDESGIVEAIIRVINYSKDNDMSSISNQAKYTATKFSIGNTIVDLEKQYTDLLN